MTTRPPRRPVPGLVRRLRGSTGLLGRLLAILLLTSVIELGASTLFYERASRFTVREDEARRLAEHLAVARRLVSARPAAARPAMAAALATEHYRLRWAPSLPAPPRIAPELADMRRQIVAWEPALARADLRLRLLGAGGRSRLGGGLRLDDGSWLTFDAREGEEEWRVALGRVALALIPATGLLVLASLLVRRTLRPIRALAGAAGLVGTGAPAAVREGGPEEVRRLVRAFNAMGERIERLIAERTEALAAVGHDLRTPLARLRLRVEALAPGEARAAIAGAVAEMPAMLASLLAFLAGEDDPEKPVLADLAVIAATVVDEASDAGGDALYDGPDHLETRLRPSGLRRALVNLVDNALHYGSRARVALVPTADALLLRVDDDGPGIPPERLDEVVRPFTRLDAARGRNTHGLGLGLAIVARAAAREGGALRLANRPDGGLRAELRLPPATPATPATLPHGAAARRQGPPPS